VVQEGERLRISYVKQGNYYEENRTDAFSSDGMVIQERDQLRIVLRTSGELGVISGLFLLQRAAEPSDLLKQRGWSKGECLRGLKILMPIGC